MAARSGKQPVTQTLGLPELVSTCRLRVCCSDGFCFLIGISDCSCTTGDRHAEASQDAFMHREDLTLGKGRALQELRAIPGASLMIVAEWMSGLIANARRRPHHHQHCHYRIIAITICRWSRLRSPMLDLAELLVNYIVGCNHLFFSSLSSSSSTS